MRRIVALLALGSIVGAAAASGATPAPRVRIVKGSVSSFALDGSFAAYGDIGDNCNRAIVWDVRTSARDRVVSGSGTCADGRNAFNHGVIAIAIAGGRVAWVDRQSGGDEAYDTLYTSPAGAARERRIAQAQR